MAKFIYLTLVSLCAITAVQTDMQCYVCTNCATVEDIYIQSCSAIAATSTTSTTTSSTSTTTVSAGDTTTTNSADDTMTTTSADDTTTTTIRSADDTTTTTISSEDNTTTTTVSSADDTTTTAISSANDTTSTTISSADDTTTTTISSEDDTTTTSISSADDTTTTTISSADGTTTTIISSANDTTTIENADQKIRGKRSVMQDAKGCVCYGNKCDCSGRYYAILRAEETNSTASTTYQCYKYTYSENGTNFVNRGCKAITQNETACSQFNATGVCSYCTTDNCNSAFSLQVSIVLLLLAMSISVFKIIM